MPSTGVSAIPVVLPSRKETLSAPSASVSKPKTAKVTRV
jgi:hypothetical protein